MKREELVSKLDQFWDVIIIGGGATGLGCAVDAASRGFKTLLLERSDFTKGTSSRSTKLIHGGLRYLKQGNLRLVSEALHERGRLCQNAPHLVGQIPFLIPNYHWWEHPFYGIGVKIYDLLSGSLGLKKSLYLNKKRCMEAFPTLQTKGLLGGNIYYDAQFDDARLGLTLAETAVDLGAVCLNYFPVIALIHSKTDGSITGVHAQDLETGKKFELHTKAVINATGVFTDQVREMDEPHAPKMIAPSQGIHLVVDRSYLPTDKAIIIPSTDDGRVLFFIPWHGHVLIGTTDTKVEQIDAEPKPFEKEIDFLLDYTARYLTKPLTKENILSIYVGLRPLIAKGTGKKTSSLSRDHSLSVSSSKLITIAGGKWTTYRKMAEDTIDTLIDVAHLEKTPCKTKTLHLHGYEAGDHLVDAWLSYGSDRKKLIQLEKENPGWREMLHPDLPYKMVEVIWAIRFEMARTVEDVLARRTRALFLNARASLSIAPKIARVMAEELGRSPSWEASEIEKFEQLAGQYFTSLRPQ